MRFKNYKIQNILNTITSLSTADVAVARGTGAAEVAVGCNNKIMIKTIWSVIYI